MPIPPSAPPAGISFSQIQEEFGQGPWTRVPPQPSQNSSPISIAEYYGEDNGIPTSGTISVSNFLGKSKYYSFSATISANTAGYNIYNQVAPIIPAVPTIPPGQKKPIDVSITINANQYVYYSPTAGMTGSMATSQPGQHPAWKSTDRISITNNGFIVGFAGPGGAGAIAPYAPPGKSIAPTYQNVTPGAQGSVGGTAFVNLGIPVRIINNGTIGGGGGGGGGGGVTPAPLFSGQSGINYGGGGGGGQGLPSSGGPSPFAPFVGNAGTLTSSGARKISSGSNPAVYGGAGGTIGQVGEDGTTGTPFVGRGLGGSPGAYTTGIANTIFTTEGTRLGPSS